MRIEVKKPASLLEVLQSAFPESSRTHLKKMIRYGCIRVPECVTMPGGVVRQAEYLIKAGWHVEVRKYQEREAVRERPPFKILFEDDSILAVYKPAGILSSGRTTEKVRSMFGMVNSYLQKSTRGMQRAYTVHRLDREVSGILLFAKSEEAKFFLQDHWTEVDKYYYALVHGMPPARSGTVQSWLKENARQVVYSVRNEVPGAKWAITHYRYLESFSWNGEKVDAASRKGGERRNVDSGKDVTEGKVLSGQDSPSVLFSLLQIKLETGRKNQIRVHLSDMGCPIVGDRKYGSDDKVKRTIRLLAYSISFPHPVQQRRVHVEIPMPDGFVHIGSSNEY